MSGRLGGGTYFVYVGSPDFFAMLGSAVAAHVGAMPSYSEAMFSAPDMDSYTGIPGLSVLWPQYVTTTGLGTEAEQTRVNNAGLGHAVFNIIGAQGAAQWFYHGNISSDGRIMYFDPSPEGGLGDILEGAIMDVLAAPVLASAFDLGPLAVNSAPVAAPSVPTTATMPPAVNAESIPVDMSVPQELPLDAAPPPDVTPSPSTATVIAQSTPPNAEFRDVWDLQPDPTIQYQPPSPFNADAAPVISVDQVAQWAKDGLTSTTTQKLVGSIVAGGSALVKYEASRNAAGGVTLTPRTIGTIGPDGQLIYGDQSASVLPFILLAGAALVLTH